MIISSTQLERVRFAAMKYVERHEIENAKVETEWLFDLDCLAVRIKRDVWAERLAAESVRWPTTWWDAVKARWFPQWALRRWPAAYSHADFTIYRGYPDLVMPDRSSVLFSMRNDA